MTRFSAQELAHTLGEGLLSFPVTHFDEDLAFDEGRYRAHVQWLDSFPIAGLCAAGGTGEFFALTIDEVLQVVRATVASTGAETPVLAPAGRSIGDAIALARGAEEAGADGILLFPPYLTEAGQEGLYRYVKAVAESTTLGVTVYSRANAIYSPATIERLADELPNLIGYKDGVGDIELMTRVYASLGERLLYIGGLPTAETFALPYLELGVTTYSSAIFNFVPQFALDFYAAVRAQDREAVYSGLREFVLPYTRIRDRQRGYAVSIVKAGLTAVGRGAGPVRPPLTDLTASEQAELDALVATAARGLRVPAGLV
jgi:5-dehydro-4-deoxyglucarate dehydratase